MGRLKPGATYVYERVDEVMYAREQGAAPDTRFEIGRDYDPRTSDGRSLYDHLQESKMWGNIHRAAKTNPTLRDALNRVLELYELTKVNER